MVHEEVVERFAESSDLDRFDCTIEEREEYEPYLELGLTIYAGVDYGEILKKVEEEANIIVWDGGNNDLSFIRTDLLIVLLDPLRAAGLRTGMTVTRAQVMVPGLLVQEAEPSADDTIPLRVEMLCRGSS